MRFAQLKKMGLLKPDCVSDVLFCEENGICTFASTIMNKQDLTTIVSTEQYISIQKLFKDMKKVEGVKRD
jgi:hypothetical protein